MGADEEGQEMVARVAIVAPGSMGAAVGAHLRAHGAHVSTYLAGRSAQTAERARAAGLAVAADEVELVRGADVFLSIVPPRAAAETARLIAAAMEQSSAAPIYADCNAVAPETVRAIGRTIAAAGAQFIDASIVGGPPRPGTSGPRFYASGPDVSGLLRLREHGLDLQPVGPEIGQASALKMCYAMWTVGTHVLATELLIAAALAGVEDPLLAGFRESEPSFEPYWNILDPLLRWKPGTSELGARLAERWDVSPDGRVWTFSLRRGIQFREPYSELTSLDVALTFERFREAADAAPNAVEWANVEKIEALDRYTVRITLRDPRDLVRPPTRA
jgi:3-hydroxyisobutyrate dehydrogenase-like beta-hydroxyacid dehydrogenase